MEMSRGTYNAVSDIDRQRLVDAFVEGLDYQAVARTLNISRQTARNIIVNFNMERRVERLPRGGSRRKKIDEEMTAYLLSKIEAKPTSTLKELQEQMRIDLPNKSPVSHQAISKKLDGLFYTLKNVRPVPVQWNTSSVKEEQRQFANWLLGNGRNVLKVFVDEFGANVGTSRSKGRSSVGERAVRFVERQRGQNVTICLAISSLGVVHLSIFPGAMTKERFGEFLIELDQLLQILDENYVVLCDNARPHLNSANFGDQGMIRYLPKFSPFMNACEFAGSCLKAAVKRKLTEPQIQEEIYDREVVRTETLHQRRIRIVSREIEIHCGSSQHKNAATF